MSRHSLFSFTMFISHKNQHAIRAGLRKEASEVLSELLDRIALIALTLGSIATAASMLRVVHQGLHLNILIDLLFFGAVVILILLRKRFSPHTVAAGILMLVTINAASNFFTLGLATIGFTMLTTCSVLYGLFFGTRYGFACLAAGVVLVGIAGVLVLTGILQPLDPTTYLHSPWTWISQAVGFTLYVVALLASVDSIQKRLYTSLAHLRHTSKELEERERTYRLLAENMRDAIFIQNVDLEITYASPSIQTLCGHSPEEIYEKRLDQLVTPESFERIQTSYRYYLEKASTQEDVEIPTLEFEYIRKDGSTFWGEMKPTFLRDSQGRLIGSQGVIRDITARKQAENRETLLQEQLRQSEKLQAIGELAGGIAHDFNNQLTGIIGMAELLRHDTDDKNVKSYVSDILAPARRAADLTAKLLAFARRTPAQNVTFDLHGIIAEVTDMLNRSIDKRIRVEQHLTARQILVSGDPTQMQNALLNIALNARDSMPNGGTISFETNPGFISNQGTEPFLSESGIPAIEIRIRDTGSGMSKEVMQRIFEPFFTTKPKGQGTGMGMAAVYGTIRQHSGSIDVQSQPDAGTVIRIGLPIVAAKQVAAPKLDAGMPGGSGTVLLIEDEDTVRMATSRILEKLGYTVLVASDGTQGLHIFDSEKDTIDLVMLDLIMPGIKGTEVFTAVRQKQPGCRVIIYSGFSRDGDAQHLIDQGAAAFVRKPFEMGILAETIRNVMLQPC